ncbi:MAG: hypothetical protein ACKO9B_10160 [Planctomycetota bacterium]
MVREPFAIDHAGAAESAGDDRSDWSWPRLLVFRFVFVWFLCEFHSALVQLAPLFEPLAIALDRAKRPFYVWIARTVCGIRIESFSESSGDTTYDWVRVATNLAIAAVGSAAWTLFDRRSRSQPRLADGLRTAIRFTVALAMFTYGLAKLFAVQFPPLEIPTLLRTYGDSSPMGLLWVFMSATGGRWAAWSSRLTALTFCGAKVRSEASRSNSSANAAIGTTFSSQVGSSTW